MAENAAPTLSKSQYMLGLQCPLALWYYRHPQDVKAANDNKGGRNPAAARAEMMAAGSEVGLAAQSYFEGGVCVTDPPRRTRDCIASTDRLVAEGHELIYEATALNPADGSYAHIDMLRRVPGTDEWDMIEVKNARKASDHYYKDLAFQYYVFTAAGYKIRSTSLMLVNEDFRKNGPVDPREFFRLQDVTEKVRGLQPGIAEDVARLAAIVKQAEPPQETIGNRCRYPHECFYKHMCWPEQPLYSVFNAFSGKKADEIYANDNVFDVAALAPDIVPEKAEKQIELECHRTGREHVDGQALRDFLGRLEYPVYYLDYESAMFPVPVFDRTGPSEQIPFQFSLHVQDAPGAKLRHYGFIHRDPSDPREAFAQELIHLCGDRGSVVVYFQKFEEGCNKNLAIELPHHAEALNAISARMVDVFEPFSKRWLYNPAQQGSVSIKKVLQTYTSLTYQGLNIPNGGAAQKRYMDFLTGVTTDEEEIRQLWRDLDEYCGLDTLAMAVLVDDVLRVKAMPPCGPMGDLAVPAP